MKKVEKIREKYFKSSEHPYRLFERKILNALSNEDTILDAGCGRKAPILQKFIGKAFGLIGVDLEEKFFELPGIRFIRSDISSMPVYSATVNIVISRAVLEHVENPLRVFREVNRILVMGGSFIFLVPNLFDYVSIISAIIPKNLHPAFVKFAEGRNTDDVFPTYYRANCYSKIKNLSRLSGFEISDFSMGWPIPFKLDVQPPVVYIGNRL